MGGACFSEFRAGYEVTNDRKNWEVIVGKWAFFSLFFFGSSISNNGSFEGEGTKNVPRIIVFVIGAACFLEFRVSYEVTNDRNN